MQRYRVNYHLLIGLFVGTIVATIALYFLWKWQLNRKASWYRERSQAALQENDKLEAFEYLEKFVKLRFDDEEARVELAEIAADILGMEGVDIEDQRLAYGILDQTVRRTGDPTARRKLADVMLESGRPQDAVTHYEELLKVDADNEELKALHCRALFRANDFTKATATAFELVGYDSESQTFDVEKAGAPHQPEIYSTLAGMLIQRENDLALAEKVIDQMVKANPDSAAAHLERSAFLYSIDKKDEAGAELDEARRLDPENSNILFRRAAVAYDEKQFETARELAMEGVKEYPDEMRFHRMLANSELGLKEYDQSIAALDEAIKQFPKERSLDFQILKIDVLLAMNDIDGAKEVIADIGKLGVPRLKPLIDFENARLEFTQKNWARAAQQLQRARPQMVDFRRMQAVAGTMLGECYVNLGKLDLALQMFDLVLADEALDADDPARKLAQAKFDEISRRIRPGGGDGGAGRSDLNSRVQQMLAKPEDEQDWAKIDAFVQEVVDKRGLSKVQHLLLQAQVFAQRKMLTEAKERVREAFKLDPNDISIQFAAAKLMLMEPPDGPPKALKSLENIEQKQGASVDSRVLKVEAVGAIGGEDVAENLHALTEGTDDWAAPERTSLLTSIGLKFLQLNRPDEATKYLNQAADLAPNNLPIRVQLFEIAFQKRDDEQMREAQKKILDLVGTEQDGNYILCEVKRRIIAADGEDADKSELHEARKMLDDALTRRPEWHELHVLYGQLLLVLGEDIEIALQHLNDALKYGPPNPNAVALQVKLLAQRGDVRQAREKMEFIPTEVRGRILDRSEAAILAAVGEMDAAFEAAQAEVERRPDDASTQSWFASLAAQLGKLDESAAAYRKACDLNPGDHENWMKLASIYAQQKDALAIENTFRDAQLALDPEFLPLIQAKFFELQGRWTGAEDIYLSIYKDQFHRPDIAQRMAAFYFLWGVAEPKMNQRAFPYANAILRAGNEGVLPQDSPVVDWARDKAVRYLASTKRYQDSLKAERLLKQIATDGLVPTRFQTLYSLVLSSRADPVSILNAIENLSALNQRGQLSKDEALLLARLYARTNNWKLGKALMLDTLSLHGGDPQALATYINLLIGQKEYTQAAQRVARFAEISNNSFDVFQLRAHLAHERGDQAEVKTLLRSMLPPGLNEATPLSEEQLAMIKAIAGLSVSFGEYELSQSLLKLYMKRKQDAVGDLVNVMALYGNVDEALPLMKQLSAQASLPIAQLATQMIRQRRAEFGDRYDQQVAELVAASLRDDPESAERLVNRAEMYEVMEKYDEAIKAYEDVMNRHELPENAQAAVMNNLAFLLAQTNQRLDDAEKLVNEAIEILGPVADALDTRAVVRMARKDYPGAVEDMTLALSIDPTAIKYYHMAKAQALAGNAEGALEAWQKAQEMEIKKESLPLIEQPGFTETEQLIQNLDAVDSN